MMENIIDKYFGFLEQEAGFVKIPEYNYVREIHNDYVRDNLIIKICYEGSYTIELLKSGSIEKDLTTGIRKSVSYDYAFFKHYNLKKLDRNGKLFKPLASANYPEKDLLYYSEILKNNPEVLSGNMRKFSFIYRIKQKLGLEQ
ncbi:MAG: hypothetical protein HGA37_09870 [Lentimicrobium sp.]|nr:hypothetical protein [Lentimicrobium sp.]